MTSLVATLPTAEQYARAFEAECAQTYPEVDAFEARMGYAVDRAKLNAAARVLACPIKDHEPCWQHGRILYAAMRRRMAGLSLGSMTCLDIGTAKGFSALCMQWAAMDIAGAIVGCVTSVDVLDPAAKLRRNTVAELDGFKTLAETLAPWPEAVHGVRFVCSTGVDWLSSHSGIVEFAFVDGRHKYDVVKREAELLHERQEPEDIIVFDDLQIPAVHQAVVTLRDYDVEDITLSNGRRYAVAVRRG